MSEYSDVNTGILSKNERREEDWHPEYRGSLNVEGVEYWIDAKLRERKDGSGKFMSLKIKPKGTPASEPAPTPRPNPVAEMDDSIPF